MATRSEALRKYLQDLVRSSLSCYEFFWCQKELCVRDTRLVGFVRITAGAAAEDWMQPDSLEKRELARTGAILHSNRAEDQLTVDDGRPRIGRHHVLEIAQLVLYLDV